jgi:hypothetical protein
MVFENRVLRRISGPKRDDVTRDWRRLHNEELCALYSSPNIFRVIKSRRVSLAGHGHVRGRGEVRTGFWWVLLGSPRLTREDNIKMDLRDVG